MVLRATVKKGQSGWNKRGGRYLIEVYKDMCTMTLTAALFVIW